MGSANVDGKKCYCAKCFTPIDVNDKVEIEGQNYHRHCSMCCVCHMIPPSLKMFYGQVFCNECFKSHVLNRFKGDCPKVQNNMWWAQWGPFCHSHYQHAAPKGETDESKKDEPKEGSPEKTDDAAKKCVCFRCLQAVEEDKVVIDGKNFHNHCARCCFCNEIPKSLKIYYGQMFCEECFNRHVMAATKDNPTEFYKACFEQWQSNPQFITSMKAFMSNGSNGAPNCPIFVVPAGPVPFCRCGASAKGWAANEPKKSTQGVDTERSLTSLAAKTKSNALEKIEKLSKSLHVTRRTWKYFVESASRCAVGDNVTIDCPVCLWQCGPIYVSGDYLRREFGCKVNLIPNKGVMS